MADVRDWLPKGMKQILGTQKAKVSSTEVFKSWSGPFVEIAIFCLESTPCQTGLDD
jgi:hypothetical protein